MGVVTKYGSGYQNPAAVAAVDAVFAEGRAKTIVSRLSIANGDSATSKFYVGRVPSNAVILTASKITHEACAGVTDFDVGLFKDGAVAVASSDDLLADGLDISSAGTKNVLAAVATADLGKRVWELLGLAADPGVTYDIIATLKADSSAAKVAVFEILYVLP